MQARQRLSKIRNSQEYPQVSHTLQTMQSQQETKQVQSRPTTPRSTLSQSKLIPINALNKAYLQTFLKRVYLSDAVKTF